MKNCFLKFKLLMKIFWEKEYYQKLKNEISIFYFNINNTKFIIKYNKKKEYIIDIKTLFNLKGEKVEIILEINSNII